MSKRNAGLEWFPLYVSDFYEDDKVAVMDYAEQGMFYRLLGYQWKNGHLPVDPTMIARILKLPTKVFMPAWVVLEPCFPQVGENRENPRLARERLEAIGRRIVAQRSGRRGAKKRWDK